eukprot:568140-Prorocentrum_minimum.AAC.1
MGKAPNKRSAFSCSDAARAANAPGTAAAPLWRPPRASCESAPDPSRHAGLRRSCGCPPPSRRQNGGPA